MEILTAVLLLLAGLAMGAAAAWLLRGREIGAERERAANAETMLQNERIARAKLEPIAGRVTELDAKINELQNSLAEAITAKARLEAERTAEKQAHANNVAALTTLRGEIEGRMQEIATAALKGNEESFLRLAQEAFKNDKAAAAALLEQKEQAIASLVNPMAESLRHYQERLGRFEGTQTVLANEVQRYGAQAQKLVTALQASPSAPGRWGEKQLENVIELAGLTDHIDYILQHTIEGEDGRLRPDLIIWLPGERSLVVDVKTPLRAYLDAHAATDDESREAHLRRHAQQVRAHMKQLAAKRYWESLRPVTPDFVVMFIPGENFYRAALERDAELLEDGWKDRVLVASPTSLVGLAMTIAFDWRREKVAENARHVGELGRELYKRLAIMGDHIAKLGNSIRLTVEHYSRFVGSLEGSVMPHARRFRELEVEGAQEPLPELKPVDVLPRELRVGGDLLTQADIIPVIAVEPPSAAE